jgi:hypothetical protein
MREQLNETSASIFTAAAAVADYGRRPAQK